MEHIEVTATLPADQSTCFELLSDHQRFLNGPGIRCEMLVDGDVEPNGQGARRRVVTKQLIFIEDIVAFRRPSHYDYLIVALQGPTHRWLALKHHGGRVTLTEQDKTTRVVWTSDYEVTTPLLGPVIAKLIKPGVEKVFAKLLAQAARQLGPPS